MRGGCCGGRVGLSVSVVRGAPAQAAFVVAVNAVRPKSDREAVVALEKTTNYTEILYLQLRDVVMMCPVLAKICPEGSVGEGGESDPDAAGVCG